MAPNHPPQHKDLTVLWTQAQPHIAAFVTSMVVDFHDAEDLIQQVAQAVSEQFDRYDPSRSFVAWSIGVARFKVYNYYRTVKRDRHVFDSDAIDAIARAHTEIESDLDAMKQALDICVKKLDGRAEQVVEMRYVREMKPARIAAKLGMTSNAVSVMLFRIRAALSKCIDKQMAKHDPADTQVDDSPGGGKA